MAEPVQTAEPAEAEAAGESLAEQGDAAAPEPGDTGAEAESGTEPDSGTQAATAAESASQVDSVGQAAVASPAAEVTAEPETTTVQALAGTREQPERIAPTGSDKLRIVINADTWADVKDANNYQLLYDLLRADSTVELSGQAPFAVFLGNGHGVEIQFNGEEIEFSSRIRNDNTARINIGG
jgi:cytoskeleton protein RodZ